MYPYEFEPKRKGINNKKLFVVMPFSKKYDNIYLDLIDPAVDEANKKFEKEGYPPLEPYRSRDDIRTISGWINVLERLYTAKIVLGVLTSNNPNVFYELGIAHATQPITRQILIAHKRYKPKFDLKDLIFYKYDKNLQKSVVPLAKKIEDAVKWYKIEEEKRVHKARMHVGSYGFAVMMRHGEHKNFVIPFSKKEKYEEIYGEGSFESHLIGITNLCNQNLIGLNTAKRDSEGVEYSYWWTGLGNEVLQLIGKIKEEEKRERNLNLPRFFE